MKLLVHRFDSFRARKKLAAIDWNAHRDRGQARNKSTGEQIVTRKYNPRTKMWVIKKVMFQKEYGYIQMMMAKVFERMKTLEGRLTDKCEEKEDDPRKITIRPD